MFSILIIYYQYNMTISILFYHKNIEYFIKKCLIIDLYKFICNKYLTNENNNYFDMLNKFICFIYILCKNKKYILRIKTELYYIKLPIITIGNTDNLYQFISIYKITQIYTIFNWNEILLNNKYFINFHQYLLQNNACVLINNISYYYNPIILLISYNQGGGTCQFINQIMSDIHNNTNYKIVCIYNEQQLKNIFIPCNSIIIINHLHYMEDSISYILDMNELLNLQIFIALHDFYWFSENLKTNRRSTLVHTIYSDDNDIQVNNTLILFTVSTKIFCATKFIYEQYIKVFGNELNYEIGAWTDYEINELSKIYVNDCICNTINIGCLTYAGNHKGSHYVKWLSNNLTNYNNVDIKYYIVGDNINPYENNYSAFKNICDKYNIHLLLLLNTYADTYSYLLTKALITGIPIFYNNIGAYIERIPNSEHYFTCFNKELTLELDSDIAATIKNKIAKPLEYIIENFGKKDNIPNNPRLKINMNIINSIKNA